MTKQRALRLAMCLLLAPAAGCPETPASTGVDAGVLITMDGSTADAGQSADGGPVTSCAGCLVGGVCHPAGTSNPDNSCEVCTPAASTTAFSADDGATCDDGSFCTVADVCSASACVGTVRDCDDGVACNGSEICNEAGGACEAGASTCASGLVCDTAMDLCVLDCLGGTSLCGGSCVDTSSDLAHCGGCEVTCGPDVNAASTCALGSCGFVCDVGFDDCDPMDSGCETSLLDDRNNCGACDNLCGAIESCRGGVCVPDFATSGVPVPIIGSTGCTLAEDSNADQIDALNDGTVVVLLRCPAAWPCR